ncbi:MAG: hypothetical protein OXI88_18065 [Gammaproteobacteria bacterium]|nr:hypothetical protein [Gammaproteobacteria bacterium]
MQDNIPGAIYRKYAEAHLSAAAYSDPVSVVNQLYKKHLPEEEQYIYEAEQFKPHYQNVMEKVAYLQIIEKLAGDDAVKYKELYEQGKTPEGRMTNGGQLYKKAVSQIPQYEPGTKDSFLLQFDDLPEHVHEAVYKEAFRMARHHLQSSRLKQSL